MATRKVRFDFNCERTLTFHHDLPARLIGASSGADPDYRQLYISALAPVMQQHADECIAASQAKCGVCERAPTRQVLTTPMSYLHLAEDPFVAVLVTPVCEKEKCNTDGQRQINDMLTEITGLVPSQVDQNPTGIPKASAGIAKNATCPCGSSRKYKKCCGAAAEAGGN
ncbi:hypothetical protein BKA67DRAFT_659621 [Truncatella angustata]|uniref:Uncharacterized protein n=1 Tax=Truncatella angustata TaxID=152316 RepID=A0A9P8ZXG3_9PEZI|nr:uncharacterized protein BKA67DRAFT_659621 [Truncatella angustata]KAH6652969.1 hypothetical protein BKA67DRAFT_659621 [Truncatella angustata]KAH8195320.1 hypothetical protein TruAng_010513 [Truncatella angustata]